MERETVFALDDGRKVDLQKSFRGAVITAEIKLRHASSVSSVSLAGSLAS
jgi:hypothetical protein